MNKLIEEISYYIKNLFEKRLPSSFLYHNLRHTEDVANTANEIAENSGLDNIKRELLLIAAWFHDTGYLESIENHEEKSVEIAGKFLNEINYPADRISTVSRTILSTKIPQNPLIDIEKILCDADLAYLGSDILLQRLGLLRKEWAQTLNKNYTDYEWFKESIIFIEANSFHTDYARTKFGEKRKKNLALLKQMAEKLKNNPTN
jgi:predicted metal-dependent HD superfamily phosphohydrolase